MSDYPNVKALCRRGQRGGSWGWDKGVPPPHKKFKMPEISYFATFSQFPGKAGLDFRCSLESSLRSSPDERGHAPRTLGSSKVVICKEKTAPERKCNPQGRRKGEDLTSHGDVE